MDFRSADTALTDIVRVCGADQRIRVFMSKPIRLRLVAPRGKREETLKLFAFFLCHSGVMKKDNEERYCRKRKHTHHTLSHNW